MAVHRSMARAGLLSSGERRATGILPRAPALNPDPSVKVASLRGARNPILRAVLAIPPTFVRKQRNCSRCERSTPSAQTRLVLRRKSSKDLYLVGKEPCGASIDFERRHECRRCTQECVRHNDFNILLFLRSGDYRVAVDPWTDSKNSYRSRCESGSALLPVSRCITSWLFE
jgi:hypothetical protein